MSRWVDEELSQRLGVTVWRDEDCPPGTAYLIPIDPAVLALFYGEVPDDDQ